MTNDIRGPASRRQATYWWPIFMVCLAIVGVGSTLFLGVGDVRSTLAFGFLITGPGCALIGVILPTRGLERLALGIAVSLGLEVVAGEIMIFSGGWAPTAAVVALGVVTMLLSLAEAAGLSPARPCASES